MRLSKNAIKEFKKIYLKESGQALSDEDAQEKGLNLLSLFKMIYRAIPEDKNNREKEK